MLAAHSHNADNAYELLALPHIARLINVVSQKYDHVIIDTPPILAFPDALLWAKMTDAAILTSFAGRTTSPDLKEVKEKLAQINVRVLGIVLSNVPVDHSYYRYGYNYYTQDERKNTRKARTELLMLPTKEPDETKNNSK